MHSFVLLYAFACNIFLLYAFAYYKSRGEIIFLVKNLIYLIKENVSLLDISKKSGIPYRTLQDIKLGNKKNPNIQTIMKISEFFKITIDDLIYTDLEEQDKNK